MESAFAELRNVIDCIQESYTAANSKWTDGGTGRINLRKKQIADIAVDGPIHDTIMEYVRFLNDVTPEISLKLMSVSSRKVSSRVKAQNSIEDKIQKYKAKPEKGKVAINKSLNDLFGARVVLKPDVSFDEIISFVKSTYGDKYRCIDSSKGEYKAVHVYFMDGNFFFQWELQIWNGCDETNNLNSHKRYKQEYTAWERETKGGGIING